MKRARNVTSDEEFIRHLLPNEAADQYPRLSFASGLDPELGREVARLIVNAYRYGQQSVRPTRTRARR